MGQGNRASRKGKFLGQKTPFTEKQIEMIETLLLEDETRLLAIRDLALFRVAISTMLRASDILKLTVGDVSFKGEIFEELRVQQKKTGQNAECQLLPKARKALARWLTVGGLDDPDQRIFPITIRHYSRLVKGFAAMLRLNPSKYSTHSLRRTRPAIIYAKTKNIEVVKKLLGHAGLQATSTYLGVEKAEAFAVSKEFDV